MVGGEQAVQRANTFRKFFAKIHGIEIAHRHSAQLDTQISIVRFERLPYKMDRAHIIVRLQVHDRRDCRILPQPVNIRGCLGARTEE